jgi:toxin ParE1/3/4
MFARLHGDGSLGVADYRLSERARANLTDIYEFTARTFGSYQADAYHSGLERTFGLLADFPLIGAAVDELAPGYRRFRFQSHLIFYTADPDHVVIRAVLHAAMDIRPQLFE